MPRRTQRGTYNPPQHVMPLARHEAFQPTLGAQDLLRAPVYLFVSGDVELLHAPRVSVVGARGASTEGQRRAARLARLLVQAGVVVVSGLARGIDEAAHTAAMDSGGRTIAVIGTALDRCYPIEHARLQERIYTEHLLVSQFPLGTRTQRTFFAARNLTMAMLSHASVIVEAGDTSGSLSQASETQRLRRPLFIMRNVVESKALTWPEKFLRHGALVLDEATQVLEAIHGSQDPCGPGST